MKKNVWLCSWVLCVAMAGVGCSGMAGGGEVRGRAVSKPAEEWVETTLFFGLSCPDGSVVSEEQWKAFAELVSANFPGGFTTLRGTGQYFDVPGDVRTLHREPSRVVIIGYPKSDGTADARVKAVCGAYVLRFHQDSVLRFDEGVQASFVVREEEGGK